MLPNIYRIAIRQLLKNKQYAIISISGVTIAIASAMLMFLYLQSERSFDRYHQDPDRIFRVVFDNYLDMGKFATSPMPVGPALKDDLPEVNAMTRFSTGLTTQVRYGDKKFFENLAFVDTGFTRVFNIEFIAGDLHSALGSPNQIILSEEFATKYFGDTDPIGQTLEIGSSGSLNSIVSGVFKDVPQNSHIQYDMVLPMSTFEKIWGVPSLWQQMPANYTYIRLNPGTDPELTASKLPAFAEKWVGNELENWQEKYQLALQPLLDIHLYSDYGREVSQGNLNTLYLLGFIGFLVLMIAGINYVNYTTAGFIKRIREVSIYKIMGASRAKLVIQFVGETFVTVAIAGLLAIALSEWILPIFNQISGKAFVAADLRTGWYYGMLFSMVLLLSVGAGIFPAIFLSGFRPSEALKGKFGDLSYSQFTRKGLIVFQFVCSVILLIATITVWRQMEYIRNEIRPKSDEQVAIFQINSRLAEKYESLKSELLKEPSIAEVSAGSNIPTFYGDSWPVSKDLNSPRVQMENYAIQDDYLETMGYHLLAGRDLNNKLETDVQKGMILNEAAVAELGFATTEEALGQEIIWGGGGSKKEGVITGVVQNFHFKSFKDKIDPAVLQFAPFDWMIPQFVALRLNPSQLNQSRHSIDKVVATIDPSWHVDLRFLDENFLLVHEKDRQLGHIFGAFAILAIFISTIGLFGLAAFAAAQRTKEVGIRKVLGASVDGIVVLLSRDFLKLVALAFAIAIPLAWYGMNQWLQGFAYSISLSWWIFVLAGVVVFIIAGLTVGIQGLKAALTDPVKALRSE